MKNKWIKKGDTVLVISGNDKGKVGEVISRTEERILVKGVNVRKKHVRRKDQQSRSEIISIERPVHISNVALSTADGKKIKLRVSESSQGEKKLVHVDGTKEVTHRVLRTQ